MKKILILASAFTSLTVGTTTSLVTNSHQSLISSNHENLLENYQINNQSNESWTWNSVGISHSVATPATGTHVIEDNAKSFKAASSQSWNDSISQAAEVVANGYFDLHTYNDPKDSTAEILKFDESKSSDTLRYWSWNGENDTRNIFGHHTSKITLTLIAKYDRNEGVASLTLASNIYARTAGAVHSCSTTSQITDLKFVV